MFSIKRCDPPANALHKRYEAQGGYVDCYTTVVRGSVTHQQFVQAFYTTLLFKQERLILLLLLGKPSTDWEVHRLASGKTNRFAAWTVEERAENQLLMCDFLSRTRSWLMVAPEVLNGDVATRLYFGSVVVRRKDQRTGELKMTPFFKTLMPFHKIYSRGLLAAAKARLK